MTEDILNEREKTHGDYSDHARITQGIKTALFVDECDGHERLNDMQREALEMIAHKMGRIIAGDPNHKDHWVDIAGYATLISRSLK